MRAARNEVLSLIAQALPRNNRSGAATAKGGARGVCPAVELFILLKKTMLSASPAATTTSTPTNTEMPPSSVRTVNGHEVRRPILVAMDRPIARSPRARYSSPRQAASVAMITREEIRRAARDSGLRELF